MACQKGNFVVQLELRSYFKKYRKYEAWVVANEFGDLKEFDDYKQFMATVSNHSCRFKKWSQDKIVYPLLPCSV